MSTVFISDIHLGSEHPEISKRFVDFLQHDARTATSLYILGDLFDVWLGDDAVQSEHKNAIAALKALSRQGVAIYVMRGNRDFLLGKKFETLAGATLIPDASLIDLYGTPTLLMHGDTLCTDDVDYQNFRRQVRSPAWQQKFLSQPVEQRLAFAQNARQESQKRNQEKTEAIMDVNADTVARTLQQYNVKQLIHGHTHRPAQHTLKEGKRIVLGDWYTQNSVLIYDEQGCRES